MSLVVADHMTLVSERSMGFNLQLVVLMARFEYWSAVTGLVREQDFLSWHVELLAYDPGQTCAEWRELFLGIAEDLPGSPNGKNRSFGIYQRISLGINRQRVEPLA